MLNRIIKISFSILGAITGITILNTILLNRKPNISENLQVLVFALVSLALCALFYFMAAKIIDIVGSFIDKVETRIQSITLSEMFISAVGLIFGLIVANLICIPITRIDIIGVPFAIIINIIFGIFGVILSLRKKNESLFDIFKDPKSSSGKFNSKTPKLLDTSTIIDGRILDICSTGFLEEDIIIPSYVLEELRHIADSSDSLRRARGRRGLDIINLLQKDSSTTVKIEEHNFPEVQEVDEKLIKTAQKLKCKLITTDYNLSKVAQLKGVKVLNVNDLANSLRPIALPGEEINVQVVKDGKESGQGVAFLEDGTMIVIEGGKKYLGETILVMVTSVLQTSAGRMVFAKPNKQ